MNFICRGFLALGLFLYTNGANAQFAPSKTIHSVVNLRPSLFVSADIDRDEDQDLIGVAGDALGTELSLYPNLGLGQFGPRQFIADDQGSYLFVSTADIDGDSFPDILATLSGTTDRIVWHKNNQDGTFAPSQVITVDIENPYFVRCADFDHDGDLDAYSAAYPTEGLFVFYNDGSGNFTQTIVNDYTGSFRFYHSDIDLDGDIDIVGQPGTRVHAWLNDGSGNFPINQVIISNPTNANAFRYAMAIGDLDGDGDPDVTGSYNGDGNRLVWYENLGNLSFSAYKTIDADVSVATPIYLVDLDLDNDLDVLTDCAVIGPNTADFSVWHENYGNGSFSKHNILIDSSAKPTSVFPTDLDNDGDKDVLAWSNPNNTLYYKENYFNSGSISGFVFQDTNENGLLDTGEHKLKGRYTSVTPLPIISGFDSTTFTYYVRKGTSTIRCNPGACWELTSDTNQLQIVVDTGAVLNVAFGVKPANGEPKLKARMSSGPTRCGFTVPFTLISLNEGCKQAEAGRLVLVTDSLVTLISSLPAATGIEGDTLWWDYDKLDPQAQYPVRAVFEIAGAEFLGDTINMPVINYMRNPEGVYLPADTFVFSSVINCSYDPNDKLVHPHRSVRNNTLRGEELVYTIRFQNTGTDTAFRVEIRDYLSLDLDQTTLRILESSHLPQVDLLHYSNNLRFVFNDILLPDSATNMAGSQGYISFGIMPKSGLPEKRVIRNSADIFFDYNAPVRTNDVRSKIVSSFLCIDSIGPNGQDIIPLDIDVVIDDRSCSQFIEGDIILYPIGGIGPFMWVDSLFSDSLIVAFDAAGEHLISLSDAGNCTTSASIEITSPDSIFIGHHINHESYPGAGDGAIVIDSLSGGTPPFAFSWNTGDTTDYLEQLLPGIYFLTVSDAHECLIEYVFEVQTLVGNEPVPVIEGLTFKPNPVIDQADVSIFSNQFTEAWCSVTTLLGQVTFENRLKLVAGRNELYLPADSFPMPGNYILTVRHGNSALRKVISKI